MLDIPGMTKEDIQIIRRNVVTVIKGVRKRSKHSEYNDKMFQKAERKFGEFNLNFKIPDEYERKWSYFNVENGILTLRYNKDKDDHGFGDDEEL